MEKPMKEDSSVFVIPRLPMAAVSPAAAYSSPAMAVPTPSPFSFSVTSTRWSSSRPSIDNSGLFLRGTLLVLSFVSSLALAATMSNNNKENHKQSFQEYPEFIYSVVVTMLTFLYSAYQLFKGILDIAYRGILISDRTSDFISFILDQLAGYLLVSCSSVTVLAIHQQLEENTPLRKAAIISVCMSIAAFLVITACVLLSGYKLCKRIMW